MNILHVTPYYLPAYPFGGVVRAVEGMSAALIRRGHQVTVLTTDAVSRTERYSGELVETIDGVRVIRVRNWIPALRRSNLSTPIGMRRIAPSLIADADVIHLHEFRTAEALIVTPAAERRHKPVVMSPHGTLTLDAGETGLKRIWDRVLSPPVSRRINAVIGLTEKETAEARELWTQFGTSSHFYTIPNGVNAAEFDSLNGAEAFRQQYGIGGAPLILFMGRLHRRKGASLLVKAFLQAAIPGAKLMIAGPDEGELAVITPMLTPDVIVPGFLDAAARRAALAAADVFVLPALGGEGLPMAVLEALAAGVPVMISPACGLPIVERSQAGVITAAEPDAIAAALRDLVADPSRRALMRDNARRLARDQFSWDTVGAQLEAVYQEVTR